MIQTESLCRFLIAQFNTKYLSRRRVPGGVLHALDMIRSSSSEREHLYPTYDRAMETICK